jgi:hypothetical protein
VYDIVFVDDGNKSPIAFTAVNPSNVLSSSVVTPQNGGSGVPEEQTLTIVPNVYFRLNYDGAFTSNLPYTATAADVEAALDAIGAGVSVSGSDLDFDVTFDADGSQPVISVDISGLDQPATVDDEVTTEGDVGVNQVQQIRIGPEITVFIPAGTQELRWTYSKTTTGAGTLDAAWVDQVGLTDVTVPELVLTDLSYTAGEYILDVVGYTDSPGVYLGTEYLDITVEAENQGDEVTATNFTAADLEVRLSIDRVFGNGDDIVLGTFNQVEGNFTSGNLMRFIGPLQLGDSIPEDTYYLMAKVDSNDQVTEYDEENNIIISENRDVEITRLPALRIYNPTALDEGSDGDRFFIDPATLDLDENMPFYTEAPLRLRVAIQNIGLDRVEGSAIWNSQVTLKGGKRMALDLALVNPAPFNALVNAITVEIPMGSFNVQELMEGRSEAKPDGDKVFVDIELALPNAAQLNSIIDAGSSIADYLWLIEIQLDATNVLRQSQIVNESPSLVADSALPWWFWLPDMILDGTVSPDDDTNLLNDPILATVPAYEPLHYNTNESEGLFGIWAQPSVINALGWETINPGTNTAGSTADFLSYAFNRNPVDSDTAGNQFPGTYGYTSEAGLDYLSMSFDLVTRSDDLVYTVVAADDVTFTTNVTTLVVIDGPFDSLTGSASLTGDGGLIDGYIDGPGGLPEVDNVLGVVDQGYSARITVRDSVDVTAQPARFIRVEVDTVDTVPVP